MEKYDIEISGTSCLDYFYDITEVLKHKIPYNIKNSKYDRDINFSSKIIILKFKVVFETHTRIIEACMEMGRKYFDKDERILFSYRGIVGFDKSCLDPDFYHYGLTVIKEKDINSNNISLDQNYLYREIIKIEPNIKKEKIIMKQHKIKKVTFNKTEDFKTPQIKLIVNKDKEVTIITSGKTKKMKPSQFKLLIESELIGRKYNELSQKLKDIINDTNLINTIIYELDEDLTDLLK